MSLSLPISTRGVPRIGLLREPKSAPENYRHRKIKAAALIESASGYFQSRSPGGTQ